MIALVLSSTSTLSPESLWGFRTDFLSRGESGGGSRGWERPEKTNQVPANAALSTAWDQRIWPSSSNQNSEVPPHALLTVGFSPKGIIKGSLLQEEPRITSRCPLWIISARPYLPPPHALILLLEKKNVSPHCFCLCFGFLFFQFSSWNHLLSSSAFDWLNRCLPCYVLMSRQCNISIPCLLPCTLFFSDESESDVYRLRYHMRKNAVVLNILLVWRSCRVKIFTRCW